jgi:UDP-N-acetyl-2-amino-2-deoxyglucuronate dehydrogenase
LRAGAHAICEKPLVLDPGDVDALMTLEERTGKRVFTILQLRLNPSNIALRQELALASGKLLCDLTYVTARGQWYYVSWKGQEAKSGGIATNIGVHFYDLLGFLFGKPSRNVVYHRAMDCAAGYLEYDHAKVRWYLSINGNDLPDDEAGKTACRRIVIGDRVCNLSGDFRELHTASYREILGGRGFSLAEARQAVETVAAIRHAPLSPADHNAHPYLAKVLSDKFRYKNGYPV